MPRTLQGRPSSATPRAKPEESAAAFVISFLTRRQPKATESNRKLHLRTNYIIPGQMGLSRAAARCNHTRLLQGLHPPIAVVPVPESSTNLYGVVVAFGKRRIALTRGFEAPIRKLASPLEAHEPAAGVQSWSLLPPPQPSTLLPVPYASQCTSRSSPSSAGGSPPPSESTTTYVPAMAGMNIPVQTLCVCVLRGQTCVTLCPLFPIRTAGPWDGCASI